MARLIVGARPLDMTAWDLSDLAGGAVTADTASEVDVTGAGGVFHYKITGTGFTTFDGNGFPTDGTVTGFERVVPGKSPLLLSDISVAATTFMGWVNTNNGTAMVNTLFAGDDTIVGRSGDDVLVGLGGNDHINLSRGGNDNANAGAGNDTFIMLGAFNAGDRLDGGSSTDKLVLDGDYSAGVTFTSTTLQNVEIIHVSGGHDYNLTLNAATNTTGNILTILGSDLGAANVLTANAAAVTGTMVMTGGTGDDVLTGGLGPNTLRGGDGDDTLTAGTGNNAMTGGAGDDRFIFSTWNANDKVSDSGGNDTLELNGNFSSTTSLTNAHVFGVETISFAAGHNYTISVDAKFQAATIDGSALGAGDSLTFNGSADQKIGFDITGGAGNDRLTGSRFVNTFDLSQGGNDTVTGGVNSDVYNFGGAFTPADHVTGGGGIDVVNLVGDYSAPINFGSSITGVNYIYITSPSVDLTFGTDNVTSWSPNVYFVHIAASTVHIDDSLVSGGIPEIFLDDPVTGTVNGRLGTDYLLVQASSPDLTINLLDGSDDVSVIGVAGTVNDLSGLQIDGGAGADLMEVSGGTFMIVPHMFSNFETLFLVDATAIMTDTDVAAGQVLNIIDESDDNVFDGSAETDGAFSVLVATATAVAIGGAGADTFTGVDLGAGIPQGVVTGGLGGDVLNNILVANYTNVAQSTSVNYDTIERFNFSGSAKFHGLGTPAHIDATVTSGTLSTATFDADLAAAVNAAHLAAGDAVLFTPNAGSLSGHTFLIVDANGVAGYQASHDYVFDLVNCTNLGSLSTGKFT